MKDYTLGTVKHMGNWPALRCALGQLHNGTLTASSVSAGDDGWIISIRSPKRLSTSDIQYLKGWFNGATFAWNMV